MPARRRDFAVIWEASGVGRSRDQLRLIVAAFGDAGHAFPAIALARELKRRGHEVLVETWEEWQQAVEGEGLRFEAAQQYEVFPPPGPDTPQGQIVARAARALGGLMEELRAGPGGQRHPHPGAGAGGGGGRRAGRDADPARVSGAAAGAADVLDGLSAGADAAGAGRVASDDAASEPGAAAGTRRAERDARAPGAGAAGALPRRASASCWRSWRRLPQLEYPGSGLRTSM